MPGYHLDADYDNDGRVTGQSRERALRTSEPGAVLLPNVDADARSLPRTVEPGSPVALDSSATTLVRGDNEPAELQVVQDQDAAPSQLYLSVATSDAARIAIHNARGERLVGREIADRTRYTLPGPGGYTMQATQFAAAPRQVVKLGDDNPPEPPSAVVRLRLESAGAGGETSTEDEGVFTIAPFLVAGDDRQPERVYMCALGENPQGHIGDENTPSVADVFDALQAAKIELVVIPPESAGGDTWVQDQFQLGWCTSAARQLRVAVHLPRQQVNASAIASDRSVASFVDEHLPSKDLGVYRAFWAREIELFDAAGQAVRINYFEAKAVFGDLESVRAARMKILDTLLWLVGATRADALRDQTGGLDPDIWQAWSTLEQLRSEVETEATKLLPSSEVSLRRAEDELFRAEAAQRAYKAQTQPVGADALQRWQEEADRLDFMTSRARGEQEAWDEYVGALRSTPGTIRNDIAQLAAKFNEGPPAKAVFKLTTRAGSPLRTVEVAQDQVQRLYHAVKQWHSSHNFGGNIEVAPATREAPNGTVVVGNSVKERPDGTKVSDMDPDLLAWLRGQAHGGQPVIEIDTSWLEVGHVDEMFAFPPHARHGAILRASPKLGLDLLGALRERYRARLGSATLPDPWEFDGKRWRITWAGASPVTMLLRGQEWHHVDPSGDPEADRQVVPVTPPLIYQALNDAFRRTTQRPLPLSFVGRKPDAPPFEARMSIFEVLEFARDANEAWETDRLLPAVEILKRACPDARMFELPVLFDTPRTADGKTSAFTPDLVNHLIVGQRIVVPRPLGPRVRPDDAAAVLAAVAREHGLSPAKFTASWLRARKLDVTWYWAHRDTRIGDGDDDLTRIANLFIDGFGSRVPDVIGRGDPAAFLGKIEQDEDFVKTYLKLVRRVRDLIRTANPGAFLASGRLKNVWTKLEIPEGTVDVFEAWVEAVADELGLRVDWVDGWFYHISYGTIHCGTNVLRSDLPTVQWWKHVSPDANEAPGVAV